MRVTGSYEDCGEDFLAGLTVDLMPREHLVRELFTVESGDYDGAVPRRDVREPVEVASQTTAERLVPAVVEQVDEVVAVCVAGKAS
jgi:hypothetical protein